jgi:hypothetical protein
MDEVEVLPTDLELRALADGIRKAYRQGRDKERASIEAYMRCGALLVEARQAFPSGTQFGQWCAKQDFGFGRQWRHRIQRIMTRPEEAQGLVSSRLDSGESVAIDVIYGLMFGGNADPEDAAEMAFDIVGDDGRKGSVQASSREVRLTTPDGFEYAFKPSDKANRRALGSAVGKRDEDFVRRLAEGYGAAQANRLVNFLNDLVSYDVAEVWMLSANERLDAYRLLTVDVPPWLEAIVGAVVGPFRPQRHPLLKSGIAEHDAPPSVSSGV